MKTFSQSVADREADFVLTLALEDRSKSRLIAATDDGVPVGILIERGRILRDGDLLANEDGQVLKICAKKEDVTTVTAESVHKLVTLAYHLGNRHVPLEIGEDGYLRYATDHVLDEMVSGLGGTVTHGLEKFEPQSGAYAHHHHHHDDDGDGGHHHHHH